MSQKDMTTRFEPVFKIECRDAPKEFKVMLEIGKYGYEPSYFQTIINQLNEPPKNELLTMPGKWFQNLLKKTTLNFNCEYDDEYEKVIVFDNFSRLILQISVSYEKKYQNVHALVAQINGLQHKLTQALYFVKQEDDISLEAFCMTASHGYEVFITEIKEAFDPKQGMFWENLNNKQHWKLKIVTEKRNGKENTYNLIERIDSGGEEMLQLKFGDDIDLETMYAWLVEWCNAVFEKAPRKEQRSVWDELLKFGHEEWVMIEQALKEIFENIEERIPFVKHVVNIAKHYIEGFKHQINKKNLADYLKQCKKNFSSKRVKTKKK